MVETLVKRLSLRRLPGWLRPPQPSQLRLLVGWLLLFSSLLPMSFREGLLVPGEIVLASFISVVVLIFLFLLRPRLGAYYEWRGAINALMVFSTCTIGFSHVLASRGDSLLSVLYRASQSAAGRFFSYLFGPAGEILVSPLYLLCALVLLVSLAFKSHKGFVLFIVLVLAYGLYPFRVDIFAGYLLWLAGFSLLVEEPLYLPARVRDRLSLSPAIRDLLLELRERPLPEGQALFLATGRQVARPEEVPAPVVEELSRLAGTGLVYYDPAARLLLPSQCLRDSHTPPGVASVADALSFTAQALVLVVALAYFAMPIDFLPEALLGPVGFLDDAVLLLLAALPLLDKLGRARLTRGR